MTILEKANQIPPCLCRLAARKNRGYRLLSTQEIADSAGLPKTTVADISTRTTWEGVPIDVVVKFAQACGVNHLNANRAKDYLKRRRWKAVKYARGHQRVFFRKLIEIAQGKVVAAVEPSNDEVPVSPMSYETSTV